jgi:cell division protein FtsW
MDVAPNRDLKPPLFIDGWLLTLTVMLVGFGFIMVYSTTGIVSSDRFGDSLFYVRKQGIAAVAGFFLMYCCSRISVTFLKRISPYCILFCICLLVLPHIPGLGSSAGGARRWVSILSVSFQPAEFMKVFFVIFLAGYFSRQESSLSSFSGGVVKPFLYVAVVSVLLLLQPDFGSCAIVALVALGMVAASGVKLRHIFPFLGVCAVSTAGLIIVSPYRMNRIISFMSPMEDASGKGYQLIQSLIAIGSGKLSGVGLGASQQKLFFLPAAHTDFIFSVIAEELGFIGAAIIIVLFLMFLIRGLSLAAKLIDDTFSFSLTVGLTLLIVIPAFLNIGVVMGLLPTKGLVLPLLGYGGSSLLSSLLVVGLLLALTRCFYRDRIGLNGWKNT